MKKNNSTPTHCYPLSSLMAKNNNNNIMAKNIRKTLDILIELCIKAAGKMKKEENKFEKSCMKISS